MITSATSAPTSSTAATSGTGTLVPPGGAMGKDEFLKLLVAQMKNQDPMNPMQGEQMAAHLAQFSSLEQLININTQLGAQQTSQTALAQSLNSGMAINALGKDILAVSDQVVVPGGGDASVPVLVGAAGGTATLRVFNEQGVEVGSRALGVVAGGRQDIPLESAAADLPAGTYRYKVEVTDAAGNAVPVQTFVRGRVDGIQYGPNGPVLSLGPITVPLGAVAEITTASGS
jgi:flagellar basal-body rod modification protein FlgD